MDEMLMLALPDFSSKNAVMVAIPAARPVTTPADEIVATRVSELLHCTVSPCTVYSLLYTSFRVADACAVSPTPSAGMTVTVMLASWGAVNSPKQADSSASPNACTSIRPRPGKLSGSFMISPTFYSNGRPVWSDGANESTEDTMNCMRPPTESLCLHQLIDTAAFIDSCHSRCRTGSQFARNFSRPDSGAYDRSELVVSLGFSRR